jgi:hypothetical protein
MSRRIHSRRIPTRSRLLLSGSLLFCSFSAVMLAHAMAIGAAQAAPSPPGQTEVGERPGAKAAPIAVTVATNKKTYAPGEPVQFTLTVRVTGKQAVHITYPSSQRFDFEVRRVLKGDRPVVWRWAKGRMFATLLSGDTLEPGRPQTFRASYEPVTDRAGKTVPLLPGDYAVTGTLTILQQAPRPTGTTTFHVR